MRFVVDAQLSPRLATWIVEQGHQADHVLDMGGLAMPDQLIWDTALERGAVVVTKDRDFVEWATARRPAPQVVWIRFGNATTRFLIGRLEPAWGQVIRDLESGAPVVGVGYR